MHVSIQMPNFNSQLAQVRAQTPPRGVGLQTIVASILWGLLFCGLPVLAADVSWQQLSSKRGDLAAPPGGSTQQSGAVVADFDGDGTNDFILSFREKPPALVFYRRNATGWDQSVIETNYLTIEAGGAVTDIDGDGDLDVVFGGDYQSTEVWWWENPAPNFDKDIPWKRHLIKKGGGRQHHDQVFGDFLGTGKPQLVFWNQKSNALYLAEIPANPREATEWPITPILLNAKSDGVPYIEGLSAVDLDRDGKTDILACDSWFKHTGGKEFKQIKFASPGGLIFAGYFKPSKYPQIVVSPGDAASGPLRWYECIGAATNAADWKSHDLLDRDIIHGHSLQLGDIDGDGNLDVFAAEMAKWHEKQTEPDNTNATAWIFYGQGHGNFRKTEFTVGQGWHEARLADLDGDGDLDLLNKPYNWETPRVDVWLNRGVRSGAVSPAATHMVTVDDASPLVSFSGSWGSKTNEPRNYAGTEHFSHSAGDSVQFTFKGTSIQWLGKRGNHYSEADVYLDGVLQASVDTYTNIAPPRLFQQVNYSKTGLANTAHTIKIVVTNRKNTSSSNYYQVIDAFSYSTDSPAAPSPTQIPMASAFRRFVIDSAIESNLHKTKVFAKFSGDGCNDLGSLTAGGFALYRSTEDWKPYLIFHLDKTLGRFEDAAVADINNDGWNDIVMGGWGNETLWTENPSGRGENPYSTQWAIHMIDTARFSHEVCAADLNRDGKCDVVTTSGIYLQGGTPTNWTFVSLARSGQGTFVANMLNNGDGYNDVIALATNGGINQIVWFENPGHTGSNPATATWIARVIDAYPGGDLCNFEMTCMALTVGDVNGDGRVDLVAASQGEGPGTQDDNRQVGDGLVWYEAPADPRAGRWVKHVIDPELAWVHAASIQLADFDGDGTVDITYAQQDQSRMRLDGSFSKQQLGIFYNANGDGKTWSHQLLSHYPDVGAGGFNSKVGIVGHDSLPSIFTSLHGYQFDGNPLLLWRNSGSNSAPSSSVPARPAAKSAPH
jgi:hypothetical protein